MDFNIPSPLARLYSRLPANLVFERLLCIVMVVKLVLLKLVLVASPLFYSESRNECSFHCVSFTIFIIAPVTQSMFNSHAAINSNV